RACAARPGDQWRSRALGCTCDQYRVSRHRRGNGDRRLERCRRDLSRRGVYRAHVHVQPCAQCHGAAALEAGGGASPLVVSHHAGPRFDGDGGYYRARTAILRGGDAMSSAMTETIAYKRSRFSTRLPAGFRYTAAHFWLLEEQPEVWRVGFTKFAT